ncbi:16570_t:CDS:2 [Funneliformis caledonium]|uniref:16570_t:CDS:1 n=1 Tax=Funneliformis caledonium TaxID=1117310 RepID=A0A9N8YUB9_9GLOM|nr:16570_t:CDS:2 [Funneliformis caledonium]
MSFNVASSSTGSSIISSSDLPIAEKMKEYNAKELNRFLKKRLNNIIKYIDTLTDQEVDGEAFLDLTHAGLKAYKIPLRPTSKIVKLINEIQRVLKGTADSVYLFINNSNVYIQGKKETARRKVVDEHLVQIDYDKLVKTAQVSRHMGAIPVVIGLIPPSKDTI